MNLKKLWRRFAGPSTGFLCKAESLLRKQGNTVEADKLLIKLQERGVGQPKRQLFQA